MPTALVSAGVGLFGSAASAAINKPDDSAQKAQIAANQRSQEFIEDQALKAENAAGRLFDSSAANLLAGNSAAANLYKDAFNPQMNTLNQGYSNAQNQIYRGMPQIQNALMGLPIDYAAFQPQQITPNTSFIDKYKINTATAGSPEHTAQQGLNTSLQMLGLAPVNFGVTFGTPSQALAMTPEEIQAQEMKAQERQQAAFQNELQQKFKGWKF